MSDYYEQILRIAITHNKHHAALLDKISGVLFLTGIITSRMRFIPLLNLAGILQLVSLSSYLLGYSIWFMASILAPDQKASKNRWFNSIQFKEQFQFAALLGLLATSLCFFYPTWVLTISYLYALSNLVWMIGEHHKLKEPPLYVGDEEYSHARQETYLKYAQLVALISVIVALATTLVYFYSSLVEPIFYITLTVNLLLSVPAFYFWQRSIFTKFTPTPVLHRASLKDFTQTPGFVDGYDTRREPTVSWTPPPPAPPKPTSLPYMHLKDYAGTSEATTPYKLDEMLQRGLQ